MLVQVQQNGRNVTGLNIGANNVRRFFPKGSSSIDLQLDHLQIQCDLQPDFWRNEPQIFDPRLSAWLEAKRPRDPNKRTPVFISLVRSDKRSFRLQLVGS